MIIFCILILASLLNKLQYLLVIGAHAYFIPQIVKTAYENHKNSFIPKTIYLTQIARIILILYIFANPYNFMRF